MLKSITERDEKLEAEKHNIIGKKISPKAHNKSGLNNYDLAEKRTRDAVSVKESVVAKLINNSKISTSYTPITVAYGDGIGPEIMDVTLDVLRKAGAKITVETVEVGEKVYKLGYPSGISNESWKTVYKNKVMLKAPITTPQGGGYKSLNVTLRKALGLYANVRPCVSYYPYINTKHPVLDIVIVRENEEDLYSGIEYRQSSDCYHDIKIITRQGCEKIVRYAFEFAKKNGRKTVTCMTKDNIMKLTDGLFHSVFDEIAKDYVKHGIESNHYIVDIGSARLATVPDIFDVVVTLNLYGDIISDVVAEMTGSVGVAGSSNIGDEYAMFEAIHGSAPTMVGHKRANPTALIIAAVQMLAHIGQGSVATSIHNSVLYTIENGQLTPDMARNSKIEDITVLNTQEFGKAIVANLGKVPHNLKPAPSYPDFKFNGLASKKTSPSKYEQPKTGLKSGAMAKKEAYGVDIYVDMKCNAKHIGDIVSKIKNDSLSLKIISTKGMSAYPSEHSAFVVADNWRCRFVKKEFNAVIKPHRIEIIHQDIIDLLQSFADANLDVIKTENLYKFDGVAGYSLSQGE